MVEFFRATGIKHATGSSYLSARTRTPFKIRPSKEHCHAYQYTKWVWAVVLTFYYTTCLSDRFMKRERGYSQRIVDSPNFFDHLQRNSREQKPQEFKASGIDFFSILLFLFRIFDYLARLNIVDSPSMPREELPVAVAPCVINLEHEVIYLTGN